MIAIPLRPATTLFSQSILSMLAFYRVQVYVPLCMVAVVDGSRKQRLVQHIDLPVLGHGY